MKHLSFLLTLASTTLFLACSSQSNVYQLTKNYKPDDQKLYKTITELDSAFFKPTIPAT